MSRPRVLVIGRGLVGGGVKRVCADFDADFTFVGRDQGSLSDRHTLNIVMRRHRPSHLILAAGMVPWGTPRSRVDSGLQNARLTTNVLDAALRYGTERLAYAVPHAIFYSARPNPWDGASLQVQPAQMRNAYIMEKFSAIATIESLHAALDLPWYTVISSNLYGPWNLGGPHDSHLIPDLLLRSADAMSKHRDVVTISGNPETTVDLLHSSDFGRALLKVVLNDERVTSSILTVPGRDLVSVRELTALIGGLRGFPQSCAGPENSVAVPAKRLDGEFMKAIGWEAHMTLREGLKDILYRP